MNHPLIGRAVLFVSGMGFPLTQLAIRRLGRRGALLVEGVSLGLLVRDTALIATGTARRLRRGPAVLLWLEAGVAALAALSRLRPLLDDRACQEAIARRPGPLEGLRQAAVGALFGLHTWRFRIYLQPDRGRRLAPKVGSR